LDCYAPVILVLLTKIADLFTTFGKSLASSELWCLWHPRCN